MGTSGGEHHPGEVLADRYRIKRLLGQGGFGHTYEAEPLTGGPPVAIKHLALRNVGEWKVIDLFERETRVLSELTHPSIPQYIEHFSLEHAGSKSFYLVQGLVHGSSLAERMASGWRPDEVELRRIATAVLDILGYLHARLPPIIHRDLKPQNVILEEGGKVWLVDFGAVRDAYRSTSLGGSTVVGTYGYMAPEQLRGVALPASDVFGLGTTLVFVLTGKNPSELPQRKLKIDFRSAARVSASLASWIERATEPAPEDRFRDANAALAALRAPSSSASRPSRGRMYALLGVLGVLLVGAGLVVRLEYRGRIASAASSTAALTPLPARPPPPRGYETVPKYVRTIPAHMSAVMSVAFTPDALGLVSSSWDGTVKLWDARSGNPIRQFAGHTGHVGAVRVTPDGKYVLSAGDSTVRMWELDTGKPVRTIPADDKQVFTLAISDDGKTLATGGSDGAVKTWSVATGELVRRMAHGSARVLSVAFAPDGVTLVTGGDDHTVKVWDLASGTLERTLVGHAGAVNVVVIAPDGETVVSGSDDHTLRVWSRLSGTQLATLALHGDEVWSAALAPDGASLLSGGKDDKLGVWDPITTKLRSDLSIGKETGGTLAIAFSRDGKSVATGHGANSVFLWRMEGSTHAKLPVARIVETPPPAGGRPEAKLYDEAMALLDSWRGRRGVLDDAEARLNQALLAAPRFAAAYAGLARVAYKRAYQSGEDYDPEGLKLARTRADKALGLDPDQPDALVTSAWIARAQKDATRARDDAAHAQRSAPGSPRVLLLAAELALDASNPDEAERQVQRLLDQPVSKAVAIDAYAALRSVYQMRNDADAMDTLYRREIELDPDSAWLKGNYASFLIGRRDYDRSIAMGQAALAQMDYGAGRDTLASAWCHKGNAALWDAGDPEGAKRAFDASVATHERACAYYGLGAYWRWLAVTRHEPSRFADAKRSLDRAIELDPSSALAREARAELR